jgi:hypothetical protein
MREGSTTQDMMLSGGSRKRRTSARVHLRSRPAPATAGRAPRWGISRAARRKLPSRLPAAVVVKKV